MPKAIYTFLDRLGVRWYTPGKWGECLPQGKVELSKGSIVEGPDFMFRSFYWGRSKSYPAYMANDYYLWYIRMRMDSDFGFGGHSYSEQIAPPKKYAVSHLEYYSLIGGTRVVSFGAQFGDHQLCVSNKEVQQLAIDFARRHFKRSDMYRFVSISPNDAGAFCQCTPCQKIGGPSDHTVFLANVVARAIRDEYPEALVGFYAYDYHHKVPERRKLEPNTVPYICNSYAKAGLPVRKIPLAKVIKDWADLSKQTAIRFNWFLGSYPYNWVGHLQDDFRFFLENKAIGAMAESETSFVHQGWVNYWAARLAWDVDLDIQAEQAELYHRFYGPARNIVKHVLGSIQNRQHLKNPLPVELLEKNRELLKKALTDLPAGMFRERTRHLLHYIEYLLVREQSTKVMLGKRYLRSKDTADRINLALEQIEDDESYALVMKPAEYPKITLGKFEQVQKRRSSSWRDRQIVYRGKHTFAIKVEKPDKKIRLHLWNGHVGKNNVPILLSLISPEGQLIYQKEVPVDTTVKKMIPVPQEGEYMLKVQMKKSNQFRLQVKNQLFVVKADREDEFHPYYLSFKTKDKPITRYFYVPVGTSYFTLNVGAPRPSEWVTFKVIAPDEKVMLSKKNWVGHEGFKVKVPAGAHGKIWELEFRNGEDVSFHFSDNIPGWLASDPNRLIVPERYLPR